MSDTRSTDHNGIDLFDLLIFLWNEKIKIFLISILATFVGIVFTLTKPNLYNMSAPIQNAKEIVFEPYAPLNGLLNKNGVSFAVDQKTIFQKFISEFNDYEEMITVLEQDEFVKDIIKDLNETDKEKILFKFAKSFYFLPPQKQKKNWTVSFQWHDVSDGIRLFENGIDLTLKNVQKNLKDNIDLIASSIENQKLLELEVTKNELNLIKKNHDELIKKHIQFLVEHSAIAKELGIEKNTLDSRLLFQTRNRNINNGIDNTQYYLRGFKAIDKEISIIQGRSNEQNLLMAEGYLDVISRLFLLENDLSASQIRYVGKLIASDNPSKWVEYDFSLGDIESKKKSKTYILLSTILGGIIGVLYVLISKGILNRVERLES